MMPKGVNPFYHGPVAPIPATGLTQQLLVQSSNALASSVVASVVPGALAMLPRSNTYIPGASAWSEIGFLSTKYNRVIGFNRVGAASAGLSMGLGALASGTLNPENDPVKGAAIAGVSTYYGTMAARAWAGLPKDPRLLWWGTGVGAVQALAAAGTQVLMQDQPTVTKAVATGVSVSAITAVATVAAGTALLPAAPAILAAGACAAAVCAAGDLLTNNWTAMGGAPKVVLPAPPPPPPPPIPESTIVTSPPLPPLTPEELKVANRPPGGKPKQPSDLETPSAPSEKDTPSESSEQDTPSAPSEKETPSEPKKPGVVANRTPAGPAPATQPGPGESGELPPIDLSKILEGLIGDTPQSQRKPSTPGPVPPVALNTPPDMTAPATGDVPPTATPQQPLPPGAANTPNAPSCPPGQVYFKCTSTIAFGNGKEGAGCLSPADAEREAQGYMQGDKSASCSVGGVPVTRPPELLPPVTLNTPPTATSPTEPSAPANSPSTGQGCGCPVESFMSYGKADGGFYCQGKDGKEYQINKLEGGKVVCVSGTTPSTTPPTGLQAAVLPPVDLSEPQEASTMPKPPGEESSMPMPPGESPHVSKRKPPSASSHVAKRPPTARGRHVAKRYRRPRGPTQHYDPAATAAAIDALVDAINSGNRSHGGGRGGRHKHAPKHHY
jgi:hypothetical protein